MTDAPTAQTIIPPAYVGVLDPDGSLSQPWRRFMLFLSRTVNGADIAAIKLTADTALLTAQTAETAAEAAQATADEALTEAAGFSVVGLLSLSALDGGDVSSTFLS